MGNRELAKSYVLPITIFLTFSTKVWYWSF